MNLEYVKTLNNSDHFFLKSQMKSQSPEQLKQKLKLKRVFCCPLRKDKSIQELNVNLPSEDETVSVQCSLRQYIFSYLDFVPLDQDKRCHSTSLLDSA